MSVLYSKTFVAYVVGSLVLVSCNAAQTEHVITPTEAIPAAPSPTTLPYWDLLPLDWDPVGGWTTLRMDEFDIAIQIPSVYQGNNCGAVFTEDKERSEGEMADAYEARLIGFEGGTIRIHIYSVWPEDLDNLVREGEAPTNIPLVTAVEHFSIGGIPAVRYISINPDQEMLLYSKAALVYYGDRLYSFSFLSAPYLPSCDAFPLSEEQVFEYLVSTVEFLE
ncbi:MAG: hypothetical protein PVI78_13420 [Anaerolineales bacterium]|jgi:hypothetical protein